MVVLLDGSGTYIGKGDIVCTVTGSHRIVTGFYIRHVSVHDPHTYNVHNETEVMVRYMHRVGNSKWYGIMPLSDVRYVVKMTRKTALLLAATRSGILD